jgi:thioredoxin 1
VEWRSGASGKVVVMSSFNDIINKGNLVLVDFFAEWCGPCKTLAPILKEAKSELGNAVSIIKIDVDKNQQLATQYQVRGVPTLVLFRNGRQVWRQSGIVMKNDLVNLVRQHTA